MKQPRIPALQGLRAIAFIAIFLSHSGFLPFDSAGRWGVSIFFVLSGFLMTYNYYDRAGISNPFKFAYTKIRKLYPLHIVTMIAAVPIVLIRIFQGTQTIPVLALNLGLNALLIQEWFPNLNYYCALNQVAWYLCACTFHYFCFPFILKLIKTWKTKKPAVISIIILIAFQTGISAIGSAQDNFDVIKWLTYNFPLTRLADFAIGAFLGYLFLKRKTEINTALAGILETAVAALIILSVYISLSGKTILGRPYTRYTLLFIPTTIEFIWLIANSKGIISKLLSCSPMVKLGNLSTCTFLIHQLVLRYLKAIKIIMAQAMPPQQTPIPYHNNHIPRSQLQAR